MPYITVSYEHNDILSRIKIRSHEPAALGSSPEDGIEFFSSFDVFSLEQLLQIVRRNTYKPSQDIMTQGKLAEAFHVIYAGQVDVIIDGNVISRLGTQSLLVSAPFVPWVMSSNPALLRFVQSQVLWSHTPGLAHRCWNSSLRMIGCTSPGCSVNSLKIFSAIPLHNLICSTQTNYSAIWLLQVIHSLSLFTAYRSSDFMSIW